MKVMDIDILIRDTLAVFYRAGELWVAQAGVQSDSTTLHFVQSGTPG